MKKYAVEMSETAEQDLENIIAYLRYDLAGDIIADKYKILFKQELKKLEDIAGSTPILDESLTGYKNKGLIINIIIYIRIAAEVFGRCLGEVDNLSLLLFLFYKKNGKNY